MEPAPLEQAVRFVNLSGPSAARAMSSRRTAAHVERERHV
jgi:hypothetical protein